MSVFKIIGAEVANSAAYGPQTFNPNTGINAQSWIAIGSQRFVNGTPVVYVTSAGNTTPTGLVSGKGYYAVYANSTGLALSATLGGANLTISNSGPSQTGHTLQGMNTLSAMHVRVYNNSGAANTIHVVNSSGVEVANMTITNAEILYIEKNPGDSIWSNGGMITAPISWRG